jgi:hypothetical protein
MARLFPVAFKLNLFSSVSPSDKVALNKVMQDAASLGKREQRAQTGLAATRKAIKQQVRALPTQRQKWSQYVCSSDEEQSSDKHAEDPESEGGQDFLKYDDLPTSNPNYEGLDDKSEFSKQQAQNVWTNFTSYITVYNQTQERKIKEYEERHRKEMEQLEQEEALLDADILRMKEGRPLPANSSDCA